MHWDNKQDLSAVIAQYISRERLYKIIQDNANFADNGTHQNEALNGVVIVMTLKAIHYATTTSSSDHVHHMIG
eukprot:2505041-Ditylum_brightwellii.AAC.1